MEQEEKIHNEVDPYKLEDLIAGGLGGMKDSKRPLDWLPDTCPVAQYHYNLILHWNPQEWNILITILFGPYLIITILKTIIRYKIIYTAPLSATATTSTFLMLQKCTAKH